MKAFPLHVYYVFFAMLISIENSLPKRLCAVLQETKKLAAWGHRLPDAGEKVGGDCSQRGKSLQVLGACSQGDGRMLRAAFGLSRGLGWAVGGPLTGPRSPTGCGFCSLTALPSSVCTQLYSTAFHSWMQEYWLTLPFIFSAQKGLPQLFFLANIYWLCTVPQSRFSSVQLDFLISLTCAEVCTIVSLFFYSRDNFVIISFFQWFSKFWSFLYTMKIFITMLDVKKVMLNHVLLN